MTRKTDIENINLQIDNIRCFGDDLHQCSGMIITWVSDIGFGEYTIYHDDEEDQWYFDSESMDSEEDKSFMKKLMSLVTEYFVENCIKEG